MYLALVVISAVLTTRFTKFSSELCYVEQGEITFPTFLRPLLNVKVVVLNEKRELKDH